MLKFHVLPSFCLAASLAPLVASLTSRGGDDCRCLYGDACWPNDSDFASLASQTSQPLIHPLPPAAACYPIDNPSGNCTDVQLHTRDGNWRSDRPGAMQNINFETYIFENGTISACYLDTTLGAPCTQGSIPPVGVDARTVEDVQAAVKFAAAHNLRLVVKNTGHDFLGRSTARNAFLLWTHHMKNITYNDTFVPVGGPGNKTYKALTVGAGVQWHEAFDAAEQNGRFVVGGPSGGGSVGAAGGWVQGGGHSAWAPLHGLGVDNALQFTVVVTSGEHLTVNSHTNSDLFWALRGGGGGTYGVVTSATHLTHDPSPLVALFIRSNFSSTETAKPVLSEFFKLQPNLIDAGWGGYSYLSTTGLNSILIAPNTEWSSANATVAPLVDLVFNSSADTSFESLPLPSFYSWYTLFATDSTENGVNQEVASRLFPRSALETGYEKIVDAVIAWNDTFMYNQVCGGIVSTIDPDSAGLNPAWRDAVALGICGGGGWKEGATVDEIQVYKQKAKDCLGMLEDLVPGGGSYFNEASLYESDPAHTFFGGHYSRLLDIKDHYDPSGLFIVAEGVGSERWDESLNCPKRQ
ncbi:FAD-binding domain-containing protein [Marasmius fiardii PR-910]|nr:FAD-binding domain-containing protein [Marasmius fiardii PR-910]